MTYSSASSTDLNKKTYLLQPISNSSPIAVSLVNMPFSDRKTPSLSLAILQSVLEQQGHSASVHNFNLLYAQMIGCNTYDLLSKGMDDKKSEQVFAHLFHPERSESLRFRKYIEKDFRFDDFLTLVSRARDYINICVDIILSTSPIVVGLTTTFLQKSASLATAKIIKEKSPKTLVVLGGADCESPMGEHLIKNYTFIDAIFHGESESSFSEYVNLISRGEATFHNLNGFSYRDQKNKKLYHLGVNKHSTDLNSIPELSFDDYVCDIRLYDPTGESDDWRIPFESSRGCWWGQKSHCIFCGLNSQQINYRKKDVGTVEEQVKNLKNKYGQRVVCFTDNIAPHNASKDLYPALGKVNGMSYFFEVKSNLKESDFLAFKQNNVEAIQPGIERLNSQALKVMKKGVSALNNLRVLKWGLENNVTIVWNYILGFPGENKESINAEINLLKNIYHLPPPYSFSKVRVDRYSPLHNTPHLFKVKITGPSEREQWIHYKIDDIDNLAYFFNYTYDEQEDIGLEDQWKKLEFLLSDWKKEHRKNSFYFQESQENVVVYDYRIKDEPKEIHLSGELMNQFLLLENGVQLKKILGNRNHLNDLLKHNLCGIIDEHAILFPIRKT